MIDKCCSNFFKRNFLYIGYIFIGICLAISFWLRTSDFNETTGSANFESTYHASLTITSLKNSPIENHWLLPTVTLGKPQDKNIPWGATLPTKTGDYIYTSFPQLGFLAPYLTFSLLNVDTSVKNLIRFNFIIGSIVSLILYSLLVKILESNGYNRQVAVMGAFWGSVISIFSKEILQSHGLVYWVHEFYQLILISGLYCLFYFLNNSKDHKENKKTSIYLILFIFLGALTEWTGYIFGVGVAILFWFGFFIEKPQKRLSIQLIIAIVLAGILTLAQFIVALGFEQAINALVSRFFARSTSSGNMAHLLGGYSLSFGFFMVVIFIALVMFFFIQTDRKNELLTSKKNMAFLFVAATIPLIENFILLQHASQFSFDRLKFVFPAAIIIALAFARQSAIGRAILSILLIFSSIQGYSSYRFDLSNYSAWRDIDHRNKILVSAISDSADIDCSVILANSQVRGYLPLLFNREIYEYKSKADSTVLMQQRKSCSSIYIEKDNPFPDLQSLVNVSISKPDGTSYYISFLNNLNVGSEFFLSDQNWINGVSKHWSGFFLPNTDELKKQLTLGNEVIFITGEKRKIVDLQEFGEYLHVHLDGPILNAKEIGLPSSYVIRTTSHG